MAARTKTTFRINVGLFLAELICVPAFIFEMKRALGGNTLSWAYVFEWPLLGLYAVYMWHKLLQEERGDGSRHPVVFDDEDPSSTRGTRTSPPCTRAINRPRRTNTTFDADASSTQISDSLSARRTDGAGSIVRFPPNVDRPSSRAARRE